MSSKNYFFLTTPLTFPPLAIAECHSVLLLLLVRIVEYNTETATGTHEKLPLCLNEKLCRISCGWMYFKTIRGSKQNSLDEN